MNDAIKVLREKQVELRQKARLYNRRHNDGFIVVRTYSTLRECAKLTVVIMLLSRIQV